METEYVLVEKPDKEIPVPTREVPLVSTTQAVILPEKSYTVSGEVVSSQTITSKTRTVETVTVSIFIASQLILFRFSVNNILHFHSQLGRLVFDVRLNNSRK